MNKKIKLASKILLVPFLFSTFNPFYSLAMENNMGQELTNVIYNNLSLNINAFVKCYGHRNDTQFTKRIFLIEDFSSYSFKVIENIYNIKLLLHDDNLDLPEILTCYDTELFLMYTEFMTQLYNLYCNYDRSPLKFEHSFFKNDFLKRLMGWVEKIKTQKSGEIEEIKNLNQDEKQKFIKYCSNISDSIFEIFMLIIENTCSNNRKMSLTIEYSKPTYGNRITDVVVLCTSNDQ